MPSDNQFKRKLKTVLKRFIRSAFFGGVIGGLSFALISPFLMPPITDLQAETGTLVDEPDIDLDIDGGPNQFTTQDNVTLPQKGQTYNYTIFIENSASRLAEDVRITFFFKGCALERGFLAEGGEAFAEPGVRFNSVYCIETVYLPDLPKGEKIQLQYEVQAAPDNSSWVLNLATIDPNYYIAYNVEYQWTLNGMTFHEDNTEQLNKTDLIFDG